MKTGTGADDKSLGGALLLLQVLFTLVVGALFTLMLFFGTPVASDEGMS